MKEEVNGTRISFLLQYCSCLGEPSIFHFQKSTLQKKFFDHSPFWLHSEKGRFKKRDKFHKEHFLKRANSVLSTFKKGCNPKRAHYIFVLLYMLQFVLVRCLCLAKFHSCFVPLLMVLFVFKLLLLPGLALRK